MDNSYQYGGNQDNIINKDDIISLLKDYIDIALYKKVTSKGPNISPDKKIISNHNLWNILSRNDVYPNQVIRFNKFYLLEWIPTSPGLYFTPAANYMRKVAEDRSRDYIDPNQKFIEYRPDEKEGMVKGGLGSLRIGPKNIDGETKHILGLSSTAISHEGIPVLLDQMLYIRIVNEIKERGFVCVDLVGSLRLLPSDNFGIKVQYGGNVPKYCVEALEVTVLRGELTIPQVSTAIVYNNRNNGWGSGYGHSFCTFTPDGEDGNVKRAVAWLRDYAIRYSGDKEPNIIGDFDEFYEHFSSVDLPIIQIANGHIPFDKLSQLKGNLNFEIIQGDKIQTGDNSIVITRSTITMKNDSAMPFKDKILFLVANPSDTSRLRIDQEAREIAEGLRRSNRRDQFDLEVKLAVRPRDLSRAILDENPQILHFSGHGEIEGIVLEDETGYAKIVSSEALGGLFSLFGDTIKCVILNSCFSEAQATEIAKHVSYVIGMSEAVPDATAISFATSFYDAIGAGKNIDFAFNSAIAGIRLEGLEGAHIPKLIKRNSH